MSIESTYQKTSLLEENLTHLHEARNGEQESNICCLTACDLPIRSEDNGRIGRMEQRKCHSCRWLYKKLLLVYSLKCRNVYLLPSMCGRIQMHLR